MHEVYAIEGVCLFWQLGLAEKNMLSYDLDFVGSDPSDPNTNSTNVFSDDTDDRSLRSTNPQRGTLSHQENEVRKYLKVLSPLKMEN